MVRDAMATDPAEALRHVPLLSGLADKERQRLAKELHARTFKAGQPIVTEGATGTGFFVIADGTATVTIHGQERARLGPGDYFGEMALIDDAPRSATITAESDVEAYGMTPWEFKPFVLGHPEVAWQMLQSLTARLRSAQ
jgi:CRP/FNR family transcriptional regulator, cyclic AMP receptor protein